MSAKIINLIIAAFLMGCVCTGIFLNNVQFIECEMCGAHVTEWWQVQNNTDNSINVCAFCYDDIYNKN